MVVSKWLPVLDLSAGHSEPAGNQRIPVHGYNNPAKLCCVHVMEGVLWSRKVQAELQECLNVPPSLMCQFCMCSQSALGVLVLHVQGHFGFGKGLTRILLVEWSHLGVGGNN